MKKLIKDEICILFNQRIMELMEYGVHKIWFLASKSGDTTLATVLGYQYETFVDMVRVSTLSGPKGNILWDHWEGLLDVKMDINSRVTRKIKEKWIRFKLPEPPGRIFKKTTTSY